MRNGVAPEIEASMIERLGLLRQSRDQRVSWSLVQAVWPLGRIRPTISATNPKVPPWLRAVVSSCLGPAIKKEETVRIGVVLSPTSDWTAILRAAQLADEHGLDAVGFYDHHHSARPEWGYICGWSAYGALAHATHRINLVPMVLCQPHHSLGGLAKESSMLALISGGRFELGIGAGDWPEAFAAWHEPFADRAVRVAMLHERVAALRKLWTGETVTWAGDHVQLTDACCTPAPPSPPRVVIGAGKSPSLIRSAVQYADEINLYPELDIVALARTEIERAERPIALSVFVHWLPHEWPADLLTEIRRWADRGVQRVFINAGYDDDIVRRVDQLGDLVADQTAS